MKLVSESGNGAIVGFHLPLKNGGDVTVRHSNSLLNALENDFLDYRDGNLFASLHARST